MTAHLLQDFLRRLRRARSVSEGGHLTDGQLLERFARRRDEAAFEVLVWRHGPMVLGLARRLLGQQADVEDVFQAAFLTLARRAAAIRRGAAVGSWLYKVAYRIALRVRRAASRRAGQLASLDETPAPAAAGNVDAEFAAVLAEEVARLPERFRAAVVLCYLQGATTAEAACVLGCPRGTVLSRLASARLRLRQRLRRRGLAPSAVLASVALGGGASAVPPAALVASLMRAAPSFAAGGAAVLNVSPQAAALAQGALQAMLIKKITIVVAMVCVLGLAGGGLGWLTRGHAGPQKPLPAEGAPTAEGLPRLARATDPSPREKREEEKKREQEIRKIHVELEDLIAGEAAGEEQFAKQAVEARLRLAECQDRMRLRENQLSAAEAEKGGRLTAIGSEILDMESRIRDFEGKVKESEKFPSVKAAREKLQKLEQERDRLRRQLRESDRSTFLREARVELYRAEEAVRQLESRQARQRETFAARREALQRRLQQVERGALAPDSADRLREVEQKLEALRRDVGELRRAIERQKER